MPCQTVIFFTRPLKNDIFEAIDSCVFRKVYIGIFHFALPSYFKSTPSLALKETVME